MAQFYLLANTSHSQMFGVIIKTKNKTVVIDGGTVNDDKQLTDMLSKLSALHVDGWFFTHPHHDHIGAFVTARRNEKNLSVDRIYCHFPELSDEAYASIERSPMEAGLWADVKTWGEHYNTHKVMPGEIFEFDDVKIQVLRVHNPEITANLMNNSSTVYRIDGEKSSVLILGDLGVEGGEETLKLCPLELLKADYTQLAHHGQQGVSREFYEAIKPKRCIWAAPDWLWDNNRGGGFDSDRFKTVRTREWMQALGVTEHYIEKDGVQVIEL